MACTATHHNHIDCIEAAAYGDIEVEEACPACTEHMLKLFGPVRFDGPTPAQAIDGGGVEVLD